MNKDDSIVDTITADEPDSAIDALLDGECVDREALRRALEAPGGIEYLVDALSLRQVTRDMGPRTYVAPPAPTRWWRSPGFAAAMLVVGVMSGFVVARRAMPAVASTQPVNSALPAATKVIPLTPGVNWTTTEGR